MVTYFNSDKRLLSRRGKVVENELKKNALTADFPLVLRYERKVKTDSFEDTLRLDSSDISDILSDREIESDVSRLCAADNGGEDIVYCTMGKISYQRWDSDNPMGCGMNPGNRFFKDVEGIIYVAKLDEVIHIGSELVRELEDSEAEELDVIDMSIDRLDYFFGVLSDGNLAEEFLPYIRSNFEDTHGFKRWVEEQKQFRDMM